METAFGIVIMIVFWGIYIGGIFYCYRVAKRFGWNKTIAVLVALAIPVGSVLIYQHYKHYAEKKEKAAFSATP
jgi:hypothetical protein